MPISYVGGQVASRAGATSGLSVTFALTGGSNATPQAGDLVVVTAIVGSQARNPAQAVATPAGYTALTQLNPTAQTYDTSLNVSWKIMGGTPDTTVTIPSTGNTADGQSYSIQVFRGVDPDVPMDVTPTSASGTGTGRPNPPSITPSSSGAWVVICGGGAAATGANYTGPTNFTTNFLTSTGADTNDSMVGSGYWNGWSSGAVDPAQYTGGTTNSVDSWAAYTLALRPAVANNAPTVLPASAIDSGAGVSLINLPSGWQAGDYLVAVIETANQTAGFDPGFPGWTLLGSNGAGTAAAIGSVGLYVFGKFAQAGETNPDTTDSGDHQLTTMIGFRGVDPTTPVELVNSGNLGTAGTTVTIGSPGTTLGADRMIALFVASGLDSAGTTTYSAWTNANLYGTPTERQDAGTIAGVGGTIGIATGRKATAGAVGDTTVTQTSSLAAWVSLAIKPVTAEVSPFSRSITEAVTLSHSQSATEILNASVSEALTLAETSNGAVGSQTYPVSISEPITLAETSNGVIPGATQQVRYIRDRTRGSTTPANQSTYWCAIQALDSGGVNKARDAAGGGTATVIGNFSTAPTATEKAYILDNTPDTNQFVVTGDPYAALVVDLGATFDIANVKIYRYWGDSRVFNETITQTSVDGIKWTTIWDSTVDGTYAESASGKTMPTKPPPATRHSALGTLIPLYSDVAGNWTTFQNTADTVESIAVFNPASGPGSAYDSAYGAKVDAFRAAGGKVFGYVSTSYAGTVNTARTTTAVNADVLKYHQWYNIDGIFFDEWAPETTYTSYASTIYSYLKGLNSTYIACGNAGPKLAEVYMSAPYMDQAVIYEETASKYYNWTMPQWARNYDRSRFAIMIHAASAAERTAAIGRSRYDNVGYVYVTDDVMANPWDAVPTYWATEATELEGTWVREALTLGHSQDATIQSGTTHAGSVTEALTLAETQTSTATWKASQTDAATLAATESSKAVFQSAQTDAAALTETQTSTATWNASQTDAATLAETQTSTATWKASQTDAATLAEATDATLNVGSVTHPVSISEALTLAETQTSKAVFQSAQTDAATLAATESSKAVFQSAQTDAATLADTESSIQVLTAAQTDALTLAETESTTATFKASQTDALTLADTESTTAAFKSAQTDAVTLADTESALAVRPATQTEALTLADIESTTATFKASATEAVVLTDTPDYIGNLSGSTTEAVTLADSESAKAVFNSARTEAVTLAETATGGAVFSVSVSEAVDLGDQTACSAVWKATASEALGLDNTQLALLIAQAAVQEAATFGDDVDATIQTFINTPSNRVAYVAALPLEVVDLDAAFEIAYVEPLPLEIIALDAAFEVAYVTDYAVQGPPI
jgi:hypothetical protein